MMATKGELTNRFIGIVCACGMLFSASHAFGQSYGVELHNTLMPASGGMGGVSVADPQDLLSAINGNPSTLGYFRGTQVTFSGAWADPNYEVAHRGNGDLPGVGPFDAKSGTPGSALGNIGISQDFTSRGRSFTAGVALISTAGLGVDLAAEPNSNNAAVTLQVLHFQPSIGVRVTDRLHVGANLGVGIGLFDGLFVGSSKATPAYGLRGSFGVNYDVNDCTRIGGYYQTQEKFVFEDAITLQPFASGPSLPLDIELDLPPNIAFGVSNKRFANGRLLLAADVIYKFWEEASLFNAVYENQLVIQLGAQYDTGRFKLRGGYVWAEDAMVDVVGDVIAGITPPGAANAIQFAQGLTSNINQHRLTGGVGVPNVLPGIDLDMFFGTMLDASADYGLTSANVSSYFLGGGLSWRFGRGSGCQLAPNEWCPAAGRNCRGCSTCSTCN